MPNILKTFTTPGPVQLLVRTRAGDVRVEAVETEVTRVRVTGESADRVLVEQDGDRVAVVTPTGRMLDPRLDVEVEVPAGSHVGVETGSADLDVRGATDTVQVKSGSGDATVGQARDAHLSSGSGDVVVRRLSGRSRVSTGSGDVHVGRLEGAAKLKSGSGDVEVGVPDDVAVWTDVRTGSGDVTSSVGGRGAPADGEPYVELHVTTGSGDVALVRAADQPFIATPSRQ
jgi:DUF4097 and DUF4098 domain-containing protein YvlB